MIGCGGVGLSAVQGARIAGAAEIVAVDLSGMKREQARRFGETDALAELPPDARLDLAGTVTRTIDLDEAAAAVAEVGAGDAIRAVVRP